MEPGPLRRLVLSLPSWLGLAAAGLAAAARTTAPRLFGTAEFRAEFLAALPQWQRVLRGMAEEPDDPGLRQGPRPAAPIRATMAWLALLRGLEGAPAPGRSGGQSVRQPVALPQPIADNYGRSDYWATPLEFFRRSGDCEDYVIAKYQSLRLLGWPPEALRLVVVQDVVRDLPHAVLAVYLDGAIYILDNLSGTVLGRRRSRTTCLTIPSTRSRAGRIWLRTVWWPAAAHRTSSQRDLSDQAIALVSTKNRYTIEVV